MQITSMFTRSRGFTLMELLVVIAIIGLLAAVVLASLNTARTRGADAAKRANLNNARAQAELFYDANGNSYGVTASGVCTSASVGGVSGIAAMITAAGATGRCASSATAWAVDVALSTGYYCVDSTGFGGNRNNAKSASATVCPSS